MALHICRDYLVQNASASKAPSAYLLAVFLRRVMGWSFVGHTNYEIQAMANTTIAVGSNGAVLPQATINVVSTTGFPSAGNIAVTTNTGVQYVIYTGTTATSFTGCSLGGGTMNTGNVVSTMLVSTGDTTPSGAPTFPAGTKAGINFGGGVEYEVSIPVAVRTVVAADVGRMLVLKSPTNPAFNSGVFVITAINAGANRYVVNWRSGAFPPAEAADTMEWWLYASDAAAPIVTGTGSGSAGYKGTGSATIARIILQSPHSTGWQVRICHESLIDFASGNGPVPLVSMVPGFDGNAAGDFLIGGRHLHTALWNDAPAAQSKWQGLTVGNADSSSNQYRLTIQADDAGQAVVMMARNAAFSANWILMFGIPDNEPLPIPTDPLYRLFTLGSRSGIQSGITFSNASAGSSDQINAGTAYGFYSRQPISATTGCWTFANGPTQGGTPFADATAGDSPFLTSTELVTVDVLAGVFHTYNNSIASNVVPQEPRLMGSIPFLRQGRTNFGLYTLSTDAGRAWQHFRNGVYMPWGGPAVLP